LPLDGCGIDILAIETTTTITTLEEIEKKIDLVTKYCKPYINQILKDLSIKNFVANKICQEV
jgi:hypothetical protein